MKRCMLLAVFLLLMTVNHSYAARPRGLFFRARPQVQRVASSYQETYNYLNWRYPKYVGGFHANYFRDMGVPPGDVGFRGNGLYVTPW